MSDNEETSLDLYMVTSKYHYNLQRLILGDAKSDDIADLTRDYTRELETTISGIPTFTEDSSLMMLDNANMELLENHVDSAFDDYNTWKGENQKLVAKLRQKYDPENFDIMHRAFSRTIEKALDVLSDTVNFLPHYADHPEVMEDMVNHMID